MARPSGMAALHIQLSTRYLSTYLFHAIDKGIMDVEERAVAKKQTPGEFGLVEVAEEPDG